ncbi:uncharacterized protein LOC130557045 [Triplophysa rosa]|uniref:uncharacterized protein LOC130557045 n=1 Tax=Triplophysa rosa TaxID=992332 RepID=UPI0025461EE4|nr:uncharacterized protein LOC130557045 [Triplophysa rosa]
MSKRKTSDLDTTRKGGRAPPEVSLDHVLKDLLEYFKGFKGLRDAENEIKKKYNIDKNTTVWNEDDVKKAWGKTKRMDKYSRRRKTWSLAIILQAMYDRADNSFGKRYFPEDYTKDDDSIMFLDAPQKRKKFGSNVRINVVANAGAESQHSTCENKESTNDNEGTNNYYLRSSKGNADSQTGYIRIPLSFMDVSNRTICPQTQQAGQKMYKLIDGVPSLTQTMKKTSYVMQYDNRTRNAAWVFEILNKKTLERVAEHSTNFFQDSMIHEYFRAINNTRSNEEYRNGQYHRGHLAAAANHKWSQKATDDTFLLSNRAPQKGDLNKSGWKNLEEKCREYTTTCRNFYVYSGPLYCPTERNVSKITYRIVGDKAVPSHFFKVIILEKNDGTLDVECYTVANADNQPYKTRKLYEIERMSGLVFSEKSPSVSNEEERVTVRWKAEEKTSEMNSVDTTFTITRSQDSKEQVF